MKYYLFIIGAVIILAISKSVKAGLFLDAPLLLVPFYLIIKYKRPIASWFRRWPLPKSVIWLVSAIPFILFEENINCAPTGCQIIPETIPILMIFVLILGLFVKFLKVKNIHRAIVIFSILGVIFELTLGAAAAPFLALPLLLFISLAIWTAISYAFLVIVPMTILTEESLWRSK